MEPLYLKPKYFKLFNSLIKLVSLNHGIKVNEVIKTLSLQRFEVELITETINYFLSQKYFYKIDGIENFKSSRLGLNEKPIINLTEDEEILEYPKLVLSLPPFDAFGLNKHLELSKVEFNSIKYEINRLFEISEESIHICSPFLELNGINDFLPLLSSKAKNGVDIKIISRQINKTNF